jgi:hypothetical protein
LEKILTVSNIAVECLEQIVLGAGTGAPNCRGDETGNAAMPQPAAGALGNAALPLPAAGAG